MSDGSSYLKDSIFAAGPDEAETWRETGFSGDFYRESDNVVRGVSMAHGQVGGVLQEPFKGCVEGDFYREPDDILKGVVAGGMSGLGMGSGLGSDVYAGYHPGLYEDFPVGQSLGKFGPYDYEEDGCIGKGQLPSIMKGVARFSEADSPPDKPEDEYFKFETTTQTVNSDQPHEIGNAVQDFLASKVTSSVTKVNCKKFSIKADVFVGSVMCTLKVRVYKTDASAFAVEFQRRSGDALTFSDTYKQAVAYLKGCFGPASSFSQAAGERVELAPQLKRAALDKADVSPLLDMASLSELPSIQAECATALSDLAQDFESAQALCTARAFGEFKKLLQSDQLDVAYPTACLLLRLVQCPEASPCFADGGVLPLVLEKVRAKSTGALVQQKLAQVLRAAVSQCGQVLSDNAFQEVELALWETIKDVDAEAGTPVQRNLAEARATLEQIKSLRAGSSSCRRS